MSSWKALDVIYDIIGEGRVCWDKKLYGKGKIFLCQSNTSLSGAPTVGSFYGHIELIHAGELLIGPAQIILPNFESSRPQDIAIAAHEAHHASFDLTNDATSCKDEQLVNDLAEQWLRRHLTGVHLHIALELITKSRIAYRHLNLTQFS